MGSSVNPAHVLLAQESAYDVIVGETISSLGLETGGILVGLWVSYQERPVLVVLGASGPGGGAERRPLSFKPDYEAHRRELDEWRVHYAHYGVDFVGMWHKHPPEIPHPSAGDLRQARCILGDPDYILPDGRLLIPISQLLQDGCRLHTFCVSHDRPDPCKLPHQVVTTLILEKFLDECLTESPVEQESPLRRGDTADSAQQRDRNSEQVPRWGKLPDTIPHPSEPYDFTAEEGRVLIGQYRKVSDVSRETRETETELTVEIPPYNLARERLRRDVQRLERMEKRYGFKLQRSPGDDLDYVELVFAAPVPIPQLVNASAHRSTPPSDSKTEDTTNAPQARPRSGELAQSIRIAFPHDYPASNPPMWVCGERNYPVKLAVLQERSDGSLEQLVETLLRWLLTPESKGLPDLIGANVEFLYQKGIGVARNVVDTLDDLVTVLEEGTGRHMSTTRKGSSPI